MGLPGAGKTTLAKKLVEKIDAIWINADKVRKDSNDWDFSEEGRLRQAERMKSLADKALSTKVRHIVVDFVCPTNQTRENFDPDYLIWVDTIKEGRFDDTNKMFVKPDKFDFHVTTQDAKNWAPKIIKEIK